MTASLGYNPSKLATETYYNSVIEQMSRFQFDLVARAVVDSNDAAFHVGWYVYTRQTKLIFRHRESAMMAIMAHCETAGTNENNGKVDPNHYGSYWDLDIVVDWNDSVDGDVVWGHDVRDLFHLSDYRSHTFTGGSFGSDQANIDMNVHAVSGDGELLFDRMIDARSLCLPLLQFMANMKMKIRRGLPASIWWYQVCPNFTYPTIEALFINRIEKDGTLARIMNNLGEIKAMPAMVA
jgi:hypothetical protein